MRFLKACLINSVLFSIANAYGEELPAFAYSKLIEPPVERPIIFNVWATWCAPCVKEMPELEALAAEGEYDVYALSVDRKKALANRFWLRGGFKHMKLIYDAGGKEFYKNYSGQPIPTTFILDKNLNVKAVESGERLWSHPEMKAKIQAFLSE